MDKHVEEFKNACCAALAEKPQAEAPGGAGFDPSKIDWAAVMAAVLSILNAFKK